MHDPIIKHPSKCSSYELAEYERVLRLAAKGYNDWSSLTQRIADAEILLYIPDDDGRFVAITAMKRPMPHYKEKVFRLSETEYSPEDFDLERGWTYVDPNVRVRGIASKITGLVTEAIRDRYTMYATAHVQNISRRVGVKHGLIETGKPYHSPFYGIDETLWVQPPGARWNSEKESFE